MNTVYIDSFIDIKIYCTLQGIQIKDSDPNAPILPPDQFWYNLDYHTLYSSEDCRGWYNNLIKWQYDSKYKHRKYLFGSKYTHMFGMTNMKVIDWQISNNIDMNIKLGKSEQYAPILVRKAPESLSNAILKLHKHLKKINRGNSREENDGGDFGQMYGLGIKDDNKEFVLSKNNSVIQKMMNEIGTIRKQWFMECFPKYYEKEFINKTELPYMLDSLSDTMVHSISLGNSSHYDINDDSLTISTWTEETIGNTKNWFLVFPNTTLGNNKAIAVKLFHGCTICWDASKLRHASSVPAYRIKGGGTSSGNCELRKKKSNANHGIN